MSIILNGENIKRIIYKGKVIKLINKKDDTVMNYDDLHGYDVSDYNHYKTRFGWVVLSQYTGSDTDVDTSIKPI